MQSGVDNRFAMKWVYVIHKSTALNNKNTVFNRSSVLITTAAVTTSR